MSRWILVNLLFGASYFSICNAKIGADKLSNAQIISALPLSNVTTSNVTTPQPSTLPNFKQHWCECVAKKRKNGVEGTITVMELALNCHTEIFKTVNETEHYVAWVKANNVISHPFNCTDNADADHVDNFVLKHVSTYTSDAGFTRLTIAVITIAALVSVSGIFLALYKYQVCSGCKGVGPISFITFTNTGGHDLQGEPLQIE